MDVGPKVNIQNHSGKITVNITSGEQSLRYKKLEWREWCSLSHKVENQTTYVLIENTSFTGSSGCELEWTLNLNSSTSLVIEQAAGTISGSGALKSLQVSLAAGELTWVESNMPIQVEVAAGRVKWSAAGWPSEGKSSIKVATGDIEVKSPKNALVGTTITKALGVATNDFKSSGKGHELSIEVAMGKASHIAY